MTAARTYLGSIVDAGAGVRSARTAAGARMLPLALALAGCLGSSSSSNLPGNDPASILPA